MLSKHQTVARFEGVSFHRCMGLTSMCPDDCGSSGDYAQFEILKYLAYEKPGEYGDPEQKEFQFQVQDNRKNPKAPEEMRKAVAGLEKGDFVLLDWQHDYVTKQGSSSPERVCAKLQKITREEAGRLMGGVDKIPAPRPKEKPKAGIAPRAF